MPIQWDDTLQLGNAEIDEYHRQIFDHFERLSLACQEGKGEKVLTDLLKYLEEYTTKHFSYEESFMAQHNYPKLAEQKEQHSKFCQALKEFQEADLQIDAHKLSLLLYRKLILWFIQHIQQSDREMVDYIVAQQR